MVDIFMSYFSVLIFPILSMPLIKNSCFYKMNVTVIFTAKVFSQFAFITIVNIFEFEMPYIFT